MARDEMINRYVAYLDACNRRAWNELGAFVAASVLVNGEELTQREYVAQVMATIEVFPDYRWELRRAIVEGEWLAVHLLDTGTRAKQFLNAPGDGARVATDELDMYRVVDGLICEVVGTVDNARLAHIP